MTGRPTSIVYVSLLRIDAALFESVPIVTESREDYIWIFLRTNTWTSFDGRSMLRDPNSADHIECWHF